jgi:ankyrin repeat protein
MNPLLKSEQELLANARRELFRSVEEDDLTSLQQVLQSFPQLNLSEPREDGDTLLIFTIKMNRVSARNMLLQYRASPLALSHHPDTPLMSPLMIAAAMGHESSVKALMQRMKPEELKLALNEKDPQGNTALHLAIQNLFEKIALLLIQSGADVEVADGQNRTAYQLAQASNTPEILDYLHGIHELRLGAPSLATYQTMLRLGDVTSLNRVLTRFPQLAVQKEYEDLNPLALILENNDQAAFALARLLLSYGVKVNGPEGADQSPLIRAVILNKPLLAEYFISQGASLELFDREGRSALYHAVRSNNLDMVELLQEYAAREWYSTVRRSDGRRIHFSACAVATEVFRTLSAPQEIEDNLTIRRRLGCRLRRDQR